MLITQVTSRELCYITNKLLSNTTCKYKRAYFVALFLHNTGNSMAYVVYALLVDS